MVHETISLRKAKISDLAAINKIIDNAIITWDIPERVRRLSLPSYQYSPHDLDTLELLVAENSQQEITGLAAWEKADPRDAPPGKNALLLHGLYVDPEFHHQGIGQKLYYAAEQAAVKQGFDGLLVKAQSNATGFFKAQGMEALTVQNESRDYMHRYWKSISGN